ncbi:MAG: hypothetical protein JWO36_1995 [Myxococcales bacterium]|nr:hypothetical protein [Myxococcales bacterium]
MSTRESLPESAPQSIHRDFRGSTRRILLVDDNEDAAMLLGELLESLGHEVVIAHDGAEALEQLSGFEPELAILDIGLPNMDGYELARRLRERVPRLRMFAISGYGEEGDDRGVRAGFELHFVKPVTVAKLVAAIGAAPA